MKAIKNMTQFELAAFVQSHLLKKGIRVVLSGGATVAFYSNDVYVSPDLDLVNMHFAERGKIQQAMEGIGFIMEGRHFIHPETEWFVEFPPGPLAIGSEPVGEVIEHKLSTGTLRIISPTDSVKDRLANYYYWNDLQCLDQAILVAQMKRVDLEDIERWSKAEGKHEEFKRFIRRLTR